MDFFNGDNVFFSFRLLFFGAETKYKLRKA